MVSRRARRDDLQWSKGKPAFYSEYTILEVVPSKLSFKGDIYEKSRNCIFNNFIYIFIVYFGEC
ncbi:hypothetical protein BACI71_70341 [Bacillus mycoides]|uniref:Uncharacterized protein n=1 Tax=Bacillus mycoides TaxID=1405 RepID=A0A654BBR8_BACMY|nr:hypothetical protein BACI71_70341 [Bacillus mycoides]